MLLPFHWRRTMSQSTRFSSYTDDRRHCGDRHGLVVFSLDHLASLRLISRCGQRSEQYCSPGTVRGRRFARKYPRPRCGLGISTMLMQIRFDTHDGPTCPACICTMYVTRRTPHPLYGSTYELQTFECWTCKYEVDRSADRSGLPHLSDAASCLSTGWDKSPRLGRRPQRLLGR